MRDMVGDLMHSFGQVIGHEHIIRSMRNSLKMNRISHAYIIDGSGGSGKKLLAKSFAKAILCESGGTDSCGRCVSCRSFENGNNPDVIYIVRDKSIGVDDVRDLITATVSIKPYRYDRKIYIVDKADTMTPAAQNALLKTIEEPAGHAVLILISSNTDNFLPTVLSRCVRYKLKPVSAEAIKEYLLSKGYNADDAESASLFSGGSIGEALNFLENAEMKALHEKTAALIEQIENAELSRALMLVNEFEAIKEQITGALDFMYMWYRDMLVYAETGETAVYRKSGIPKIAELLEKNTKKSIFIKLDSIIEAKRQLSKYANFQMTVEMMLLKMKTEEI